MRPAVFLDRDGVINPMWQDPDHGLVDAPMRPEQFSILPGVIEAIRELNCGGYMTVVVSNQPGIAKGKQTPVLLEAITQKMRDELGLGGANLDAVYYCRHHPEALVQEYRAVCDCRKPRPGLLYQAARDLRIDLAHSFMVGDGVTDVQAGRQAGCRTIWVGRLKCDWCQIMREQAAWPDWVVADLPDAVKRICERGA